MTVLLDSSQAIEAGVDQVGGKASGLARLVNAGANVPWWNVIGVDAFHAHLKRADPADLLDRTLRSTETDDIEVAAEQLRTAIIETPLDPDLVAAVEKVMTGRGPVAVRSSAVGEDGAARSFAGMYETFLFRTDAQQVVDAIRRCWASAFNARSLAYRRQQNDEIDTPSVAVIVQDMVDGTVSGVLFTDNPVTGSTDELLISASWGLGEGVVNGTCNTDDIVVSHTGAEVSVTIGDKDIRFVRDEAGGVREEPVPDDQRKIRCLEHSATAALATESLRVATAFGAPQDIEWTLHDGKPVLLQARPITAKAKAADPSVLGEWRTVWDNSNIQESFNGVTLPLTFSWAAAVYEVIFRDTLRMIGVREQVVIEHEPVLRNMVGLVSGRVYYNINNWYRVLQLTPSFERNKTDVEKMIGLEHPVDFIEGIHLTRTEKLQKIPHLVPVAATLGWRMANRDKLVQRFLAEVGGAVEQIRRDYAKADGLGDLLDLADDGLRLFDRWSVQILNDLYLSNQAGRARRLLGDSDNGEELVAGLLAAQEAVESLQPTMILMRVAVQIRGDDALRAALSSGSQLESLAAVREQSPAIAQQLDHFIDKFGDRCMGEQKLETISLRQDPSFVTSILRNYVDDPDIDPERFEQAQRDRQVEFEREALASLSPRERKRLIGIMQKARAAVRARESMRLTRTRIVGVGRAIYCEVGRLLSEAGELADPRDVFYLTMEELRAFADGRSMAADLDALVRTRKTEFAAYEDTEPPNQFETFGPPYSKTTRYKSQVPVEMQEGRILRGTGCWPGIVEGDVQVVLSPTDDLSVSGKILTTMRTDPGWGPLFPSVKGLLIERGSTLSHSAVLSRELGIPAVVGVPGLMSTIRSGERVRLDGGAGIVERLDDERADAE
ncbi:phosphoenolpyruvate synthase [Antrihabitans cavernicola]|uniref:Phosphoenolpyruvate synthase n=1 Tax=Antrihabitans cavernicola TaxID=2495913 RepID=A0A5A7SKV3_9NOCA|nr:phosphoenolpyruvate synthase [Spelaeibacter cavernicola]KAA0024861.1 phosphoenolpyruvate synthase [Spelaeibacter cavernicola]